MLFGCAREVDTGECRSAAITPDRLPADIQLATSAGSYPFAEIVRVREIAGEPRPVLPGVRAEDSIRNETLELPAAAAGPLQRRIDLSAGRFRLTERVGVAPRIRLGDWEALPLQLLEVAQDDAGRHVMLELDLSAWAGREGTAKLSATVYALPLEPKGRFRSKPMQLPERAAWLAFGIGINEPAWDQGPVRYRLSGCEKSGECRCLHEEVLDPSEPQQRGWQERRLSLAGLEGHELSFRFETEVVAPRPHGYLIAQWALPRVLEQTEGGLPGRHDLLLISLDTLRADHLGSYGYRRETSPYMNGPLAAASTVFEQAVAPATTTAPSHMTLFTSLQPSVHGVVSNLRERALPEAVPTLASVLRHAGYATGSVNEDGALNRRSGFDRGFDFYLERSGASVMDSGGVVAQTFESGRRFIERHRRERWFLFLHTYEVHYPYSPPAAYESLFRDGDAPDHPDNVALGPHRSNYYPVRYDREIRHVDASLRALIEGLDAAGLLDDAIVVVTSDHGEAFLEHDLIGHGTDVHQEEVHVPLFVRGPGLPRGLRIADPVGLLDVMPSLLDLLDAEAPAGLMGHSFAPLLRGESAPVDWRARPLVSEAWHPWGTEKDGRRDIDPPVIGVRRGDKKLIRTKWGEGPRYELYDLAQDPGERRDLYDPSDRVARELVAIADAYESQSAALVRARGLPPLDIGPEPSEELEPERLEALKALGYIE